MIEILKIEQEIEKVWPMSKIGTHDKWLTIRDTIELLNKVIEIRLHTSEELGFIHTYHEMLASFDNIYFKEIENHRYENRYLPLELAKKLNYLYNLIQKS